MSRTEPSIALRRLHLAARTLPAVLIALSLGCGDSTGGSDGGNGLRPLGASCTAPEQCEDALCAGERCSRPCVDDSGCAGGARPLVCGIGAAGSEICLSPCEELSGAYVCEGGRPVSCAHATADACSTCGCSDQPGTFCDAVSDTCMPLEVVGGPCETDSDCASANCSTRTQLCRVPIGATCDETNCDVCRTRSNGTSYCSSECTHSLDCNGGECIGSSAINLFHCTPSCSTSSTFACPGQCEPIDDFSGYFCACEAPGCTTTYGKGDLGDLCRNAAMCTSGNCWSVVQAASGASSKSIGFCTQPCATNDECGAGLACVNANCNATTCTSICLPSCTMDTDCRSGTCRGIANVDGVGLTPVCTVRKARGESCWADSDCRSVNCNQFGNCE